MRAKASGSDEDNGNLEQRIRTSMVRLGFPELRQVTVSVDHETVSLYGDVPSFHIRQMAVECARRAAGVRTVVDTIQVVREPGHEVSTHQNQNSDESTEID